MDMWFVAFRMERNRPEPESEPLEKLKNICTLWNKQHRHAIGNMETHKEYAWRCAHCGRHAIQKNCIRLCTQPTVSTTPIYCDHDGRTRPKSEPSGTVVSTTNQPENKNLAQHVLDAAQSACSSLGRNTIATISFWSVSISAPIVAWGGHREHLESSIGTTERNKNFKRHPIASLARNVFHICFFT